MNKDIQALKSEIERWSSDDSATHTADTLKAIEGLLDALTHGRVRAAEPTPDGWVAVPWVKRGILLAFKVGRNHEIGAAPAPFFDKDTLPLRPTRGLDENIRVVPGGTSVRAGHQCLRLRLEA